MNSERALIERVEAADPAEFAEILRKLSAEEGRVLRTYLGEERLQAMRSLALQADLRRGPTEKLGNVVVLPGIMASELSSVEPGGDRDLLWVSYPRLIAGQVERLRLGADGRTEDGGPLQVQPIGIMKKYYGELLLGLNRNWQVQSFAYDWRKDVNLAADELHARISGWFGDDEPVHLVAHSLGGLVARAFILRHGERWKRMQDPTTDANGSPGCRGGRVIMLGTPNRGSFAIVQLLVGIEGLIRTIAKFDLRHNERDLARICNTFVSTYQMLPAPDGSKVPAELYKAQTYPGFAASQRHLDAARKHHDDLARPFDHYEQLFYVAGANRATLSELPDGAIPDNLERLEKADAYGASYEGDGRVLWERGRWKVVRDGDRKQGPELPIKDNWYYVEEVHADLPRNKHVRAAIDDLLAKGTTSQLTKVKPATRARGKETVPANAAYVASQDKAVDQAGQLARRLQTRAVSRGTVIVARDTAEGVPVDNAPKVKALATETPVSTEEVQLRDLLLRGGIDDESELRRGEEQGIPGGRAVIKIGLVPGVIQALDETSLRTAKPRVDAIAVGHYLGVRPQTGELAIDRAITAALNKVTDPAEIAKIRPDDCVLTQFTDRQTFLGELGRPFFLDDPREAGRVVAVAGMGPPGRLGQPELVVLVRELCWSLDRLDKRHLATILIGAGNGNVPPREAVRAWLRGLELAQRGWAPTDRTEPPRVTFVIRTLKTLLEVHQALVDEADRLNGYGRLQIDYDRYSTFDGDPIALDRLREKAKQTLLKEFKDWQKGGQDADRPQDEPNEPVPTRLTLDYEGDRYSFSAITRDAAVPERTAVINPTIVLKANDELAQEGDPEMQAERGVFLQLLLFPEEFRPHLATTEPLVLLLDARTARIHWEMVAQPDPAVLREAHGERVPTAGDGRFDPYRFLGTARGFTRQLRTTFAPPPEPPPPPRRRLRVLVVADPADDASLPGAEVEGGVVADLFEAYNRLAETDESGEPINTVEVRRLFGPTEATLTNVLRELIIRPYDVFHFAGHCFYNKDDPPASGYIFRLNPLECLTARELNRIDRIPRFVFSNACESGVTQDRLDRRSIDLPPSFAESFFNRGVANFVCTAWPVDDQGAREFATRMYARMLGLTIDDLGRATGRDSVEQPWPIHQAMQEARIAIARNPTSARTWGAYQHYGNPFYRFFAPRQRDAQAAEEASVATADAPAGNLGKPVPIPEPTPAPA